MPKKQTKTQLKKKLWKEIRAYIRRRDNSTCWLCHQHIVGSNLHTSHILPKGEYPGYEFEDWNLKALCMTCHLRRWHRNPLVVASNFFQMYPEKYREAIRKSKEYKKNPVKYSTQDIMDLYKLYLDKNSQDTTY